MTGSGIPGGAVMDKGSYNCVVSFQSVKSLSGDEIGRPFETNNLSLYWLKTFYRGHVRAVLL